MSLYKNKLLLYLIMFFHNLIPAYVIERLFSQERGISVQMVVYCEFIYAATIIVLEIPSGVLSDILGSKRMLVLSAVMPCLEFLLLIFSTSFWHFAFAVFFAGIGRALSSGAYNSLLYRSLASCGKSGEFEKIIGKMNAIDFSAGLIAALSGGYLAFKFNFIFNYWLSLISCIFAFLISLGLKEPPKLHTYNQREKWKTVIKTAYTFFKINTNVLRVIIHSTIIAACIIYIDEFWQLYLKGFSFPVVYFGIASSVLALSRIPCSVVSAYMLKFFKHNSVLLIASTACAIGIIISALVPNMAGMFGIVAAIGASALINPVVMGYLHHKADESARATIESVSSLIERVFSIVAGLVFSIVAARHSVATGFMSIGVILLVVSGLFSVIYAKAER